MTADRRIAALARAPAWLSGAALLLLTAPQVRLLADATYGGSARWLWAPAVAAGFALLVVAALTQRGGQQLAVGVAGATWLVGDLAGWSPGHEVIATAADAWTRLLPGLIAAGLLVPARRDRPIRIAAAAALVGAALAGVSRLVLVDPFLDVDCWRGCYHNPLLIEPLSGAGRWLETAGVVVTIGGVAWAGVAGLARPRAAPRPKETTAGTAATGKAATAAAVTATVLALATVAPAALRLVLPERATHPAYLACSLMAQAAAVLLAALALRGLLAQWRLSRRLARLAAMLPAAPPTGAVGDALRVALGDPQLVVRYWAPERNRYVDAAGEPADDPAEAAGRLTLVTRRGRPVAALTCSSGVDGDRVERALGAALRLALENEQLRAATLAELRELRASRARVVARGQLERRRLERNLHDGAQQRMVSLALLVRMLAGRATGADGTALAVRAEALTRATIEDLRRVARGIHPAVLADAGLAGAVLDLAESSIDLPVVLDGLPTARYTGLVETTAYVVAAAALTDARREGATMLVVHGHERGGGLCLEFRDDAPVGPHTSVRSLTDQVRAVGGDLTVEQDAAGTRIRAELPCGS
jgi:signal transduction histidine kinase